MPVHDGGTDGAAPDTRQDVVLGLHDRGLAALAGGHLAARAHSSTAASGPCG